MKAITLDIHRHVCVTWFDSNFARGWRQGHEDTISLPVIKTVGYVTAQTEDAVEIAGTLSEDGGKLNPLSIPWGCVRDVEEFNAEEEPLGN